MSESLFMNCCLLFSVSAFLCLPADDGFEREIYELRGQLARSVGAISSAEELKRSLEKSERQRVQLSDHLEVGPGTL